MNHLLLGTADMTDALIERARPGFLLIDDGPIADAFSEQFRARAFDPAQHRFNPLRGLDYKRACDFVSVMQAAFPAGQDTLTKEGAWDALLGALLEKPRRLDHMLTEESKDPGYLSAQRMVRRVLRSPVLEKVLCGPPNFSFKGSVIVRINRAELGDFDALILALLLIGQAKGQVIVPDGGFYLRPLHMSLIRQDRLAAAVNTLAELGREDDPFRLRMEAIEDKEGRGCVYKDAVALASYAGLVPDFTRDDSPYNRFIREAMKG